MDIGQLRRGQEHIIARLTKRSHLRLYAPLSVEDAIQVSQGGLSTAEKHMGASTAFVQLGGFPVTTSVSNAIRHNDIIIQFEGMGKQLEPPPHLNTREHYREAEVMFPDSDLPLVSMALLYSENPWVVFTGSVPPQGVDAYHLVGYDLEGKKTTRDHINVSLSEEQFEIWEVNSYQKMKRTGKGGGGRKHSPFTSTQFGAYWRGTPTRDLPSDYD